MAGNWPSPHMQWWIGGIPDYPAGGEDGALLLLGMTTSQVRIKHPWTSCRSQQQQGNQWTTKFLILHFLASDSKDVPSFPLQEVREDPAAVPRILFTCALETQQNGFLFFNFSLFFKLFKGFLSPEILLSILHSLENLVTCGQGGITRWDSQTGGLFPGHVINI